jgi:hypothetical protein
MIAIVLFSILCAVACVAMLVWLGRDHELAAQFVVCKAALYMLVPAFLNALALGDQYSVTLGQLCATLLLFAGALAGVAFVRARNGHSRDGGMSAMTVAPPVPRSHLMILMGFCLIVFAVNVVAWFQYDTFIRRIGTEQVAALYAGLPSPVRIGMRLWDVLMGPILIVLVAFYWKALKLVGKTAVCLMCAMFVVYTIITSRLLMLDFALLLLIARRARFMRFVKFLPLLLIPAIATFLMRSGFDVQEVRGQVWSQWVERVDCFSVVGEIDKGMWTASDPLLGESWMSSTLGRVRALVDPTYREAFLASAETGSKNAINSSFALGKGADYVSCIVSDVYGNLWLPGMFLIGFVLVWLASVLERHLHRSRDLHDKLFFTAGLATVLIFERDLSDGANVLLLLWGAALAICWAAWSWQRATRSAA